MWSISGGLKPWTLICGKRRLMSRSSCFVPLELQLRVQAALQEDLVAAQRDRLLDLPEQLLALDDVAFRVARLAGERAEAAAARADVRVVDVAVDVVGAIGLRVQAPRRPRRPPAQARPDRATRSSRVASAGCSRRAGEPPCRAIFSNRAKTQCVDSCR